MGGVAWLMDEHVLRAKVAELMRRADVLRQQSEMLRQASDQLRRDFEALRTDERRVTPRPSDEHPTPED
jgi:hypothetical protein